MTLRDDGRHYICIPFNYPPLDHCRISTQTSLTLLANARIITHYRWNSVRDDRRCASVCKHTFVLIHKHKHKHMLMVDVVAYFAFVCASNGKHRTEFMCRRRRVEAHCCLCFSCTILFTVVKYRAPFELGQITRMR